MKRAFALSQHLTAFVALAFFTWRILRNLGFLRPIADPSPQPELPARVSVLVPARNEARTIVACIESLLCQDYPNFEVIVLDDQSTDATPALLDALARKHPNLTVIHGIEDPPFAWNGKSYACQRLADHATGEWLLFTDSDTLHTRQSIARGVAQAEALQVDLLSALPRQITHGLSERIVVSFLLDFLPLIMLDLPALASGATTSSAAGNSAAIGQYLLVRADRYRAAGGHAAIAHNLVDDFALAAHLRAAGSRMALVNGIDMLACRMYRSPREVWQGFSKNVLAALATSTASTRRRGWQLLLIWTYACVFLMPWYRLLFATPKLPALFEVAWLTALRAVVNRQFARPHSEMLATPLAAVSVVAFSCNALLRRQRHKPVTWKDRAYDAAGPASLRPD
jgi:chlorobactene glucosyltransferase